MMARDQSRRREGTRLSGVCGGEEGRAGWSGGSGWGEVGTTDSSSPGRKPCFPSGSISVADTRTFSASCKEEVGRQKLHDKKRRRGFVSGGAISQSPNKCGLLSRRQNCEEHRLGGTSVKSFKSQRPCEAEYNVRLVFEKIPEEASLNCRRRITKHGPRWLDRASGWFMRRGVVRFFPERLQLISHSPF